MQEATARIHVLQGEVEMTRSQLAAANAATADKVDALDRSSAEVTSEDLRALRAQSIIVPSILVDTHPSSVVVASHQGFCSTHLVFQCLRGVSSCVD